MPRPPHDRDNYGPRFNALFEWLDGMVAGMHPNLVAIETPIVPVVGALWDKIESDAHTIRFMIGLATIAELVAARHGVRCIEVAVSTAKVVLAGTRWATKRDMIAAAVRRGFAVADDHQADACAVALAALDHVGA